MATSKTEPQPRPAEEEVPSERTFRLVSWNGECPHCKKPVRFEIKTDFGVFCDPTDTNGAWYRSLSDDERAILAVAESCGVYASFEAALKQRPNVERVRNPKKTFLGFVQRARPAKPSPGIALILQAEFGANQTFMVFTGGDITAIMVGGLLRMFTPTNFLHKGKEPKGQVATVNGKIKISEFQESIKPFAAWSKTKMGYVPVESKLFMSEIRKRSYGAFSLKD